METPQKPEVTVLPRVNAGPELALVSAPDQFVAIFNKELGSIEKMDQFLERMEVILLGTLDKLEEKNDDRLLLLHSLVMKRKGESMKFVLKALEFGLKTKLANKLLGEASAGEQTQAAPTQKVLETRVLIQKAMARDLAGTTSPQLPS